MSMLDPNEGEQEILEQDPSELGEAGESSESGDGDKSAGEQPTVAQLQEALRASEARAEQSQRILETFQTRLMEREDRPVRKEVEEEEEQPETDALGSLTEEQLSGLTNKQILELSRKAATQDMVKIIEKKILPKIEERLSNLGSSVEEEKARRDVAQVATKYQDFWAHKNAMVQLSQDPKYRSLGAEDLYVIAKSKSGGTSPTNINGGKVTNPTPAQKAAARASGEKPVTMGGGTQGAKKTDLTDEEAADAAWNKVFGNKKAL